MEQSVLTTHTGKMNFESGIGGHTVLLDTSAANGGSDSAPSPKPLMLASLGGCTAVDIVSILEKMRVPFSGLSVDVRANLTEEHPKIYDDVTVTYRIKLAENDRDKMVKAVNLSADKYCGVMAMFRKFADVTTEIVYL